MSGAVVVFVEHVGAEPDRLSLEALALGRSVAGALGAPLDAVLLGSGAEDATAKLGAHGVGLAHVAEDARLDDYTPAAWAAAIRAIVAVRSPAAVIAAGSERGNEVLAHVAARAGVPMAANVVEVMPTDSWRLVRQRWAGSLLEDAALDAPLRVMTVAPHAVAAEAASPDAPAPTVTRFEPELEPADLVARVVSREARTSSGVSLGDAKVVVGGGRGVGSAAGFEQLEQLAGLLGGAVGGSRVVTSLGWRPHSDQIGQTGLRIAPDLYIACGISGAIQHIVGCKAAKRILAINTDPDSPIMAVADYAVIGDLGSVVPAISAEIARRKGIASPSSGAAGIVTAPTRGARAVADPVANLTAQLDALREVLRAISTSPFDLEGVLGIVVERMSKLCHADIGLIYLPAGEGFFRAVVPYGMNPEHAEYERSHPTPITPGTMVGRVALSGDTVQIEDAAADPSYTWTEGRQLGGFHSFLGVPIRKEGQLIGQVGLARMEVRRFSDDEIKLVQTFADQAAIVIDNVRLAGTIERQREELARYLPSTVAELVSSPDGEQLLAGHRREVTAVYCDLRGFTSFAEAAEPEEVLDVVREYHREMGTIIVAHGATLEHFAGDGMMIFLNDPQPVLDHPAEAVRMAVELLARFAVVSERWRRLGFELGLGIGISMGHATLGRVGFEGHLGYAIVGSVPNLAARLCAVAEPGQIVLSERVYALVESIVTASPLGPLELKGFRRPVSAYALSGFVGPRS